MAKHERNRVVESPPMADLTPDTAPVEAEVAPPETLNSSQAESVFIDLGESKPSDARPTEPIVQPPETLVAASAADVVKTDRERAKLERERRRFVKRTGGLRKNLCSSDARKAEELSAKLGLKVTDPWLPMHIAGYDNIEHGAKRGQEWNNNEQKARV